MKRLYLGLDAKKGWIHYPVIKIVPSAISSEVIQQMNTASHLLFTSKTAVKILHATYGIPQNKIVIAVGQQTSKILSACGVHPQFTSEEETAEGVVALLKNMALDNAHIFWPHSALSRNVLPEFFKKAHLKYTEYVLYNTVLNRPGPLPDLHEIDEIHFTSPSTVDNFLILCPTIPPHIKLTAIGPVTKRHLQQRVNQMIQ